MPDLTFGSASPDLARLAGELSRLLGVHFLLHESGFRGGEYLRAESEGGELILQRNYDAFNHELAEEDRPDIKAIFYISGLEDAACARYLALLEEASHDLGLQRLSSP